MPTMVSVLVSAETMDRAMAHHGAVAAAQEVVAEAVLPFAEARSEPGDGDQVCEDDRQIQDAHGIGAF